MILCKEIRTLIISEYRRNNSFFPDSIDILSYMSKIEKYALFITEKDKDGITGLIAYYANDVKGIGYITLVVVRDDIRGKGMGRRLINSCIDEMKINGMNKCKLEVHRENSIAIRLYTSMGFEFDLVTNGTKVFMVKDLN